MRSFAAKICGLLNALFVLSFCGSSVAEDLFIDFESYRVGLTLDGQDGWKCFDLVQLDYCGDFKPQGVNGNVAVECNTRGLTEYYRGMPSRSGITEFTWKWKALHDDVNFMIGPCDELTRTNNNYRSYRVRVTMRENAFEVKGAGWETPSFPVWETETWYHMRLVLDPTAGTFSLYSDTDPNRATEIAQVENASMAGEGAIERIMMKADQARGNVQVDEIGWRTPSVIRTIQPGPDVGISAVLREVATDPDGRPVQFLPGTYKEGIVVRNGPVRAVKK